MKNTYKIILILTIINGYNYSFSQTINPIEKKYYKKVIYKKVPNRKVFKTLTPNDKDLQQKSIEKTKKSISNLPDSIIEKYSLKEIKRKYKPYEYINNRSRIFFNSNRKKGVSLPCYCQIKKDTLTIATGAGFFGGLGFASQISMEKFINYYWEYSDVDYVKLKKENSILKRSIEIDGIYQKMILESKPKVGETLTGYFSILTKPYYIHENKTNVYGEVYFKCLVYRNNEDEVDKKNR